MICPKCKADTRVVDSRPSQNGEVIRRRRVCDDCSHRFPTYETTFNAAAHRRQNAEYAKARRKADPEWARRQDAKRAKRRSLQKQAIAEAAETGRPLAEIAQAWGIAVPAAYSASPNP